MVLRLVQCRMLRPVWLLLVMVYVIDKVIGNVFWGGISIQIQFTHKHGMSIV